MLVQPTLQRGRLHLWWTALDELMNDEGPPRHLPERTGRHYCSNCLKEIPATEYFEGDFVCRECSSKTETYPLATTPQPATANRDSDAKK